MNLHFQSLETLQSVITAGAAGFLLKQEVHDPETIAAAIRTVHHGNAYMTPSMTAKILTVVRRLSRDGSYDLTKREREILQLITEGRGNREIAGELAIDVRTVANHVSNLLFKMGAKNRT